MTDKIGGLHQDRETEQEREQEMTHIMSSTKTCDKTRPCFWLTSSAFTQKEILLATFNLPDTPYHIIW